MEYAISAARYCKDSMVIQPRNTDGYRNRADRLAGTFGRWSHRAHGYVVRPSSVAKFEALYAAGWDASCMYSGVKARRAPSHAV